MAGGRGGTEGVEAVEEKKVEAVGVGQRLLIQREMITRGLLEKRLEDVTGREV